MFKGQKPSAQPRSLRSIAEDKGTAPAGFDGGLPYVPQNGLPLTVPGATEVYEDDAMNVTTAPRPARSTAADPSPFGSVRKKG